MLPFDSPRNLPPLQLGAAVIPAYGSLTVNEAIALEDIYQAGNLRALATLSLSQSGADLVTQAVLATVLLVSRNQTTWTLERVLELPPEDIRAACDFFLRERDAAESAKESLSKDYQTFRQSEFDWAYLFWRLQRLYPHDRRFSAMNFGNCPIALIEKALETANHLQMQQASVDAAAVAQLGMMTALGNGCSEPKPEWFNPYASVLSEQAAKAAIDPEAARAFLQLTGEGVVPGWVVEIVDVDLMRLAAK